MKLMDFIPHFQGVRKAEYVMNICKTIRGFLLHVK